MDAAYRYVDVDVDYFHHIPRKSVTGSAPSSRQNATAEEMGMRHK